MLVTRSKLALALAGCAVALAACGSSGNAGSSPGSSRDSAGIKFAGCMRAHGVQDFPDPSPGGGIQIPDGINPQAPAFRLAQSSCSKLLPRGGPGARAPEARRQMLLKLAQCMRSHGISSFPDPSSSPPSGPPAGGGIAFGAPGAFISVPQTMIKSPGFKQAATACGFPGLGGAGGPKAAAAG